MLRSSVTTKLKTEVLGPDYDLSLAFIDSAKSHELNRQCRGKDKPANVLSFPLGPQDGEIFIDQELVKTASEQLYMFIHGLLHLKGYAHGSKMESEERKLLSRFAHYVQKHRRRT